MSCLRTASVAGSPSSGGGPGSMGVPEASEVAPKAAT
jgi:hypothetical protein